MPNLKIHHILILSNLLSKGARHDFVSLTTSSLGRDIHKSQQSASKHLSELEDMGLIERINVGRKYSIKITSAGFTEIASLYSELKSSLESSPSTLKLTGTLISGMGEGAYYMSLEGYTSQFKSKIGYTPFPGTLNVKLDKKENARSVAQLTDLDGILIDSFSDGKRTYGWVKCFHAKINDSIDCELIRLERTHHDTSIVELISKKHIRKLAKIKIGSKIKISVSL